MASTTRPSDREVDAKQSWVDAPAKLGLGLSLVLMAVAVAVPKLTGWQVTGIGTPPLYVRWDPRLGVGTAFAVSLAALGVVFADRIAKTLAWRWLLVATYFSGLAWLFSLATVDATSGIGQILDDGSEYLRSARGVTDLSLTLHEYISRIPYASPNSWPIHVSGHPPGALLFFVGLVRLGLGSGLAAGCVVILIAASTPIAVMVTARRLGSEFAARNCAPFLVLGPAAVWLAVSADAVFAAVAAWGICCLAMAATAPGFRSMALWSGVSGLLLGYAVMMSYGLPLMGLLAVAVLLVARRWQPLLLAGGAASAVLIAFAVAGFSWLAAYPVLRERYWVGIASVRPASYWLWGDLAALGFSAGPVVGSAVAITACGLFVRWRSKAWPTFADDTVTRLVVLIGGGAAAAIVVADASLMSKGEVERIWLPFVPWLLLGTALLPTRWRRLALIVQVVTALSIQHLLDTHW